MADETITCDDLNEAIERYTRDLGFQLDMITPADAPREALLSKDGELIGLVKSSEFQDQGSKSRIDSDVELGTVNLETRSGWVVGRARMMYRDLIPNRLGGKLVASHIRILDSCEVADSVHYHKIDFQIIYCLMGAIRVVYEEQGDPFWLMPGDCVLQPPEIRHRVLEAVASSEVIEVTSPAEHETWFDHELNLPTEKVNKNKAFGNQLFVRHRESTAAWKPSKVQGISSAKTQIRGVHTLRRTVSSQDCEDIVLMSDASLKVLIEDRGIEICFAESALRDSF